MRPRRESSMEEEGEGPSLLGSVVERSFTSSIYHEKVQVPRPTIFPFPVARHRSHGPHWVSLKSQAGKEDESRAMDGANFDQLASFSQPVQRNKRQGLHANRWKKTVQNHAATPQAENKDNATEREPDDFIADRGLVVSCAEGATMRPSDGRYVNASLIENQHMVQSCIDDIFNLSMEGVRDSSVSLTQEQSCLPLDLSYRSDIDVQNRAFLMNMSAAEILEAQSEVIKKMNPTIIEMLKNRRHKMQNHDMSESPLKHEKSLVLASGQSCAAHLDSFYEGSSEDTATSSATNIKDAKNDTAGSGDESLQQIHPPSSRTWKTWADRVENARALTFSLDGCAVQLALDQEFVGVDGKRVEDVVKRDLIRTDGDPASAGYTIREAVALMRSTIPGHRVLALQLVSLVLKNAICYLHGSKSGQNGRNAGSCNRFVDWQAVWAYALGPEPELVLSLRLALDDHNVSVVFACVEVIQCLLCCKENEIFLRMSSKLKSSSMCTAPIFRRRSEFKHGFLQGGFWKYSAKPSDIAILRSVNKVDDTDGVKGTHTVRDDIVVAEQDAAAGLIRMMVLSRLQYLLEMHLVNALDEPLLSILVGIAQHSPLCADAIMNCSGLLQIIVKRFVADDAVCASLARVKSIALLKVLAQSDRKKCEWFVRRGVFEDALSHLFRHALTPDRLMGFRKEEQGHFSLLIVEQLSFWKVCIQYGYCISYLAKIFPIIHSWLGPPLSENIFGTDRFLMCASIAREAYLLLAILATKLPHVYSEEQLQHNPNFSAEDNCGNWLWSFVVSAVDLALKWLSLEDNPCLHIIFFQEFECDADISMGYLLWVVSAAMNMLTHILDKLSIGNVGSAWLVKFVEKYLKILEYGLLSRLTGRGLDVEALPSREISIFAALCRFRHHENIETSLSSVHCLLTLVKFICSLDKILCNNQHMEHYLPEKFVTLKNGIFLFLGDELNKVLLNFIQLLSFEWRSIQSIEIFGRAGPAPGVGVGWGALHGGFWSHHRLLAMVDAELVMALLNNTQGIMEDINLPIHDLYPSLLKLNCLLCVCLIAGPEVKHVLENALDFLFQPITFKLLSYCIRHCNFIDGVISCTYDSQDLSSFCKVLREHCESRWLLRKCESGGKHASDGSDSKSIYATVGGKSCDLDIILEDMESIESCREPCCQTLMLEWAYQRLPLPVHWFLSPLCSFKVEEAADSYPGLIADSNGVVEAGLFFLLGLEAMSSLLSSISGSQCLPVLSVPLLWKLHSLTMVLLGGTDILVDEKVSYMYENLQKLYGKFLDQSRMKLAEGNKSTKSDKKPVEFLKFKMLIFESYPSLVEMLVEQYSAVSFGDIVFGRQVALYLHQSVEAPVRLATWTSLSSLHVLELLPPLSECLGEGQGYLEPAEENSDILEAYVKSWITGCLDRAATRNSVSFTLAIHHLSSFIFQAAADEKVHFRKKLCRSLLRCSDKLIYKEMMLKLVCYQQCSFLECGRSESSVFPLLKEKFKFLCEACDGNSFLLMQVKKLKS